jgi:hypothetical protein
VCGIIPFVNGSTYDMDCVWKYYSFCEWINLGVEIDDDWNIISNIDYDVLDDIRGDFLKLFEDDVVPTNGWDEIA